MLSYRKKIIRNGLYETLRLVSVNCKYKDIREMRLMNSLYLSYLFRILKCFNVIATTGCSRSYRYVYIKSGFISDNEFEYIYKELNSVSRSERNRKKFKAISNNKK